MRSFTPPNPYFNGIDFNDKFYSQTSGSYITLTYANSHYLYSYSGANAISKAITTNFNGSVGIGTTAIATAGTLNATTIYENGVLLSTKYQANISATPITTATNTRAYPPAYLTGQTTTLSNCLYGNGTYIATAGSLYGTQDLYSCIGSNPSFNPIGGAQWTSGPGTINASCNYIGSNSTLINGSTVFGETATIQLPSYVVVNSYSLTANGNYSYNTGCFNTWYFCGSTDGINYTQLDYRSGVTFAVNTGSFTTSNFTFTNLTGYNYYRFVITKTSGTGYPQIVCDGMTLFGYEQRQGGTIGALGIGTTSFQYGSTLEVYGGFTYLDSPVGINTSPISSNALSVSGNTYLSNVGINTSPISSNALSLSGNTYLNGNVGIGTTASTFQLDIYNPSSTINVCRIQSGSANGSLVLCGGISGSLGYVSFYNTAGTQCGYVGFGGNLANYIDLFSQNGYLGYRTNGNLIIANSGTNSLIFDNAPNSLKIQLSGAGGSYAIGVASNIFLLYSAGIFQFQNGSTIQFRIDTSFFTYCNSVGTAVFAVDTSGNINSSGMISTKYFASSNINQIIAYPYPLPPSVTGTSGYWLVDVSHYLSSYSVNVLLVSINLQDQNFYWTGRWSLIYGNCLNNNDQSYGALSIQVSLVSNAVKITCNNGYNINVSDNLIVKIIG